MRISRDQTGEELGVQRQREDCLELAQRRGWDVGAEYVDNDTSASGKAKRPQFEAMLGNLASYQVIVAWSLDRLTRNRKDTVRLIEACQEQHITIGLARGSDLDMATPMGRMMADQLAGWARYEIEQKSDRHKRANLQKAQAGKPHGSRRPFGYNADQMTVNPAEAAVLGEMANKLIAGWSFKEVAWWANEQGYRTTTNKQFLPLTIRNMMLKPRYGGKRVYQGVEYAGTWQPVFDAETWERLQLKLRARQAANGQYKSGGEPIGLLNGLAVCGSCGLTLNCRHKQDRPDSPIRRQYYCRVIGDSERRRGCGGVSRGAIPLEHYIGELVLDRLTTPELGKLLDTGDDDSGIRTLLEQRTNLAARLDGLADDYALGILSKPQMQRASATGQAELQRLSDEIERYTRTHTQLIQVPVGETLHNFWATATDEQKRSVFRLVLKKVIVQPGASKPYYYVGDQRYRFDPELIEPVWID